MPLYEYHCTECGTDFEELVALGERSNPSCPACGSPKSEKNMSIFGSFISGSRAPCGSTGFPCDGTGATCGRSGFS